MKKISTLFKKDPNNLGKVINEINPENKWVFDGDGVATQKFDGTACAIIDGNLYRRYDVKKGKSVPTGAMPCQEPDIITGHWPHWVLCGWFDIIDKYHMEGFIKLLSETQIFPHELKGKSLDGTYELIGEKVQGNPEKIEGHRLIKHGSTVLKLESLDFEYLKNYLSNTELDIEGIVFHHKSDGRMCKLRKSDFGVRRQ